LIRPDEIEALGTQSVFVRDDFAGRDVALRALDRLRELPLRAAAVGKGKQLSGARGDQIAWVDDAELRERFEALRVSLNQQAWLGLDRFDLQIACYSAGAAYERHHDAFRNSLERRVTAIWYLNPDWRPEHGGILRLHHPQPIDVEPILDRLVVFLSEKVEHEVLVSNAPRWALTAWYHGPAKI
jgi:SM-20-related protein